MSFSGGISGTRSLLGVGVGIHPSPLPTPSGSHHTYARKTGGTHPNGMLSCCRCNVVMNVFENAYRVAVTEDVCEECSSQLLDVNFNKVNILVK